MVKYDSSGYRKHKRPKGWGSLCPDYITQAKAEELLKNGVQVGSSIYNVDGSFVFQANSDGADTWHGFPIPWGRLPSEARKELIAAGQLSYAMWRKALRQKC